ncbi:hypothetical protein [Paraclostridium bifermentans]|uniref:hypothetical protein n=1 Tax=Paraclostridium bifermentans TaxID=1490 RepID=UPI00359C8957
MKIRNYDVFKIKRWNIHLILHFAMLLIFFFMTQLGAILIGFTYLDGDVNLQVTILVIANFIFYKVITGLDLL